jgi:hypothetical protein
MNEPFELLGIDPENETTHVLIRVRSVVYLVYVGQEQLMANQAVGLAE